MTIYKLIKSKTNQNKLETIVGYYRETPSVIQTIYYADPVKANAEVKRLQDAIMTFGAQFDYSVDLQEIEVIE